jgi:N12 class adenine-specific DNA methylase
MNVNDVNDFPQKVMKDLKDPEKWMNFLEGSSWHYKYNFYNQMLIVSQRPDATAVTTIKAWNKKLNRIVNVGSKRILLIENDLKYNFINAFDVSDTHKRNPNGLDFKLWKRDNISDHEIIQHMMKADDQSNYQTLPEYIITHIIKLGDENIDENLPSILDTNNNDLITNSANFQILTRCGYNARDYFTTNDFIQIESIKNLKVLMLLGDNITEITKPFLIEMGKTIQFLKQEEYENKIKGELSNEEARNETQTNRIDVLSGRGFSNTERKTPNATKSTNREVRNAKESISSGEQSSVSGTIDLRGQDQRTFSRNRSSSQETIKSDRGANAQEEPSTRQERRSHGVGGTHEQYSSTGPRDRDDGTHLQLNLFQNKETIIESIKKAESQKPFAFSMPQKVIDIMLQSGSNQKDSDLRICAYYKRQKSSADNIDFLKEEYGGGKGFIIDEKEIAVWLNDTGIQMAYGKTIKSNFGNMTLSWEDVDKRIHELLDNGHYLPKERLEMVDAYEREKIAEKLCDLMREVTIDSFMDKDVFKHGFPEAEKQISKLLLDPEEVNRITNGLDVLSQKYDQDQTIIRFNFYNPHDALKKFQDFQLEKHEYLVTDFKLQGTEMFITDDEISNLLKDGSGVQEGKERIDAFFSEEHSLKEKMDFLKHEYGTGGRAPALSGTYNSYEDHSAKGIILTRNYPNNKDKVHLTWSNVAKEIDQLIKADDYIQKPIEPVNLIEEKTVSDDKNDVLNADPRLNNDFEDENQEKSTPEVQKSSDNSIDLNSESSEQTDSTKDNEQQLIKNTTRESQSPSFKIKSDQLGVGTPRKKFQKNIEAIKTLQVIEKENRRATSDEQTILSQYVGWGGLPQAFDPTNIHWKPEVTELKNLISDEEYNSAKGSTLNAHYTSPIIINGMYEALDQMGFKKGKILEPAMGVGHFFGLLPDTMKDSKLYGVELDNISGCISQKLYPEANIRISGFEKTDFPNDFFDVAIGNVPFGDYKVYDRDYDKYNLLIHDYFFAKSLDKVREGGVVAFITSKGTLDKKNPMVRKYLGKRAELIGAIRLPNNAFKDNAGTEVTSDIIFLKKRKEMVLPDNETWIHLEMDQNNIPINQYFVDHPEMILGNMEMISGRFGEEAACVPTPEMDLKRELKKAIQHINYQFQESDRVENFKNESLDEILPADPQIKSYSYTIIDEHLYYQKTTTLERMDEKLKSTKDRIIGLMGLRDCTRELIDLQLNNGSDEEIRDKQTELNGLYDSFSKKQGLINSFRNQRAFDEDGSYWLLCALEELNEDGTLKRKAAIFNKRTIKPYIAVTSVDTSSEALIVSMNEKARVDIDYMANLTGKTSDQMVTDLEGLIFRDPGNQMIADTIEVSAFPFVTADDYLSGNVKNKLKTAQKLVEILPEEQATLLNANVAALTLAQNKDLEASEIEVRLGATWVDPQYIQDFIIEAFQPGAYLLNSEAIKTRYSSYSGVWNIEGKNADSPSNVLAYVKYGTKRINAYQILESTLNLKDVRVCDTVANPDGSTRQVINKNETILANQKQEMIKEAFSDWIFKDPTRRDALTKKYNELFNSIRPREYDGSHVVLHGISPEIKLRDYQLNAISRALYGGNTLLAHCVGAGKTFEMTAIAMESKYLGLSNKSLFVVPNHLIGQWSSEFLSLYPGANILVSRKKDFKPENRKKFCSRIATGDYDAIIIGHSQFEKIPLSKETLENGLKEQINDILMALESEKQGDNEHFAIKQMEKTRKSLEAQLNGLSDDTRKDNVLNFEELGIDRLFIDESQNYKNLYIYTKMRNVAGIGNSKAKKATDMFNKCQYLDKITNRKGIVFATGTPISNSITELYTMMRYLQYDTVQEMGLGHFDEWASTFAEAITAIELSPEGNGYRSKTRLARFYNLPELMSIFKEVADIQTPDMLKLPVPNVIYKDVVIKPSEHQKAMLLELVDRADKVRQRSVEPYIDNMLKITNDGRKLALDQRLIDPLLADADISKANQCAKNVFDIWEKTQDKKSTQLVFCDLSTPHNDGRFNIYQDIKEKTIAKGLPENEIAFIHDANTDAKKAALFSKVRKGSVRVLIGSTPKMGAGTNVQDKLIALHHLDVPWRPSDINQQEGRILRQGNENQEVQIFRYITEETFDSYSWQLIENKQKFISQVMTSKIAGRSCEDVDEQALSYAEVKALATGNPYIKEKMNLDIKVTKLKLIKANFINQCYRMEDNILKAYPQRISNKTELLKALMEDEKQWNDHKPLKDDFKMVLNSCSYTEKKDAGNKLLELSKKIKDNRQYNIGDYAGFKMIATYEGFDGLKLSLKNKTKCSIKLGADPAGNILRIDNTLNNISKDITICEMSIQDTRDQLKLAKEEIKKPFPQEDELNKNLMRLNELNTLLSMDTNNEETNEQENNEEWEPEV